MLLSSEIKAVNSINWSFVLFDIFKCPRNIANRLILNINNLLEFINSGLFKFIECDSIKQFMQYERCQNERSPCYDLFS